MATAGTAILIPLLLFPETLEKQNKEDDAKVDVDGTPRAQNKTPNVFRLVKERVSAKLRDAGSAIAGVGVVNLLLLALSILCAAIGIKATDWWGLVQYPVVKLSWTFSEVRSAMVLCRMFFKS